MRREHEGSPMALMARCRKRHFRRVHGAGTPLARLCGLCSTPRNFEKILRGVLPHTSCGRPSVMQLSQNSLYYLRAPQMFKAS